MAEDTGSLVNDSVRLHLHHLQREFAGRLPARLSDIHNLFTRLSGRTWDASLAESLHRLVHSLTGAAGTFGLRALSDGSRSVEQALATVLRQAKVPDPAEWARIGEGIERMAELALARPSPDASSAFMPLPPAAPVLDAVTHLVTEDRLQAVALTDVLQEAGHRVCLHNSLQGFKEAFVMRQRGAADAVVLDVAFPRHDPNGEKLMRALELGRHGRTPVVVSVRESTLAARLQASRAGASQTLLRPLDGARLCDMLDTLTGRPPRQAFRVLLVDDDRTLLEAQARVLRAAGMEVHPIANPLEAPDAIASFAPDVLLLDVHMPEASGPELAAALREDDAHVHMPILFLSAETDLTQQLIALNLGGDDFLVKPVRPAHLVAAVTARARRARHAEALRQRLQTTVYEREREHLALDHHAIVYIANGDGVITYANEQFCRVSGYERRDVLGMTHSCLSSPMNGLELAQNIRDTIHKGQVWHGELRCMRKNGSNYWVESTFTPFLDDAGHVYQYVAIQTDVSHIKAAEAALRAQRDMQRVISDSAARLMTATSAQLPQAIHDALRQSGQQLGADRAHLFRFAGTGVLENTQIWCAPGIDPLDDSLKVTPVESTPWLREQFYRFGLLNIPDVMSLPAKAARDRERMQERQIRAFLAFPLQRDDQIYGFIGYSVKQQSREWQTAEIELLKVLADVITSAVARKLAESALRESESRLNFLVSSSPVVIYTRSAQAPYATSYVSPNVKQLMGFDPDDVLSEPLNGLGFVHPEDRLRISGELGLVATQESGLSEYRMRRSDGTYRWMQDQCRLVRDAEDQPVEIIGYLLDITERKQAEQALQVLNSNLERRVEEQTQSVMESERFARATLDALSARVVILDSNGCVLAANRAWESFGAIDLVREGHCYTDVCDSACGLSAQQPLAKGIGAVIRGEQASFFHEYMQRQNTGAQWFLCRAERFPGNDKVRVVVSHENITEMKLAERQQLRSQRLESLGTLAGGVAHDLNNALAPVLMGMNLLKEQYPEESKLFSMIQNSAQRGADMVRQLLTFARGAEGERVAVCPSQVVRELERLMKGSFPKNIRLKLSTPEDLPSVMGDPTQLHQVLLNLCVNARDAMPNGGTLSVSAQVKTLNSEEARAIPDAKPGRYLVLSVGDTGSGIPHEILDRIFDPFFTTKGADKGTGLGLSTVLGIARGHGGFVQVSSQLDEGTLFSVYLPAVAGAGMEVGSGLKVGVSEQPLGSGETVLFVDDELAVREVGSTVLKRLNYQPLLANDGREGLARAAEHRATLRVVVTDLQMPHMDGLAFVRALRLTLPDLPIVVASGRMDETVAAELLRYGVSRRLNKPFTEAQLAQELHDILSA